MSTASHLDGVVTWSDNDRLTSELRRAPRTLTIAGLVAILLGVIAISVPAVASLATSIFVGWILMLASAHHFLDALSTRNRRRAALRLVLGALTFAAGLYLVVAPLSGAFTLTVVLVVWFIAVGTARIVVGLAEGGAPGAVGIALSGGLAVILAVLIAEQLPSSASWAIGLLVGVDLVFSGVRLIALARALRRLTA